MAEAPPRVVLALPASAHGRPEHQQALAAVRRAFPGCEVVGPERRWDTILTHIAARAKLEGAHAFVFGAWEGRVSRGILEMANSSREREPLGGGSYYVERDELYPEWRFEELPPGERTRRHFAAVRAVGPPWRWPAKGP